ncbi:MAG: uroporphyrinogen decarboxylase [Candidatus Thermoplasmatota archaeon]|nr:uroporphyrinogen decarboxylase [Candidatus Thermoplasmatota archaeon]
MNGKQRIVSALNLQPVDRTPVWFMRQAGRHLPEYRKIAADHSFWERCMDVDLCTKITLQPLERYKHIDAAIIFSDILTPLPSLGYDVEYGGGIRISEFDLGDVDDWSQFNARKHAPWAADGLKSVGEEIGDHTARLGFVGCPWTICMYLLSGGTGDKDFHNARAKVYSNPEEAKRMLLKMGEIVGDLLADQVIHGGADAVQVFDTWAGLLSPETYREFAMPATAKSIEVFREKVGNDTPLIHYAKGSGHLHGDIRNLNLNAISLDWRDDLALNREHFGEKFAFQGNLDPSLLHGSTEMAKLATRKVLNEAGDKPGHIFNLGHGFAPSARIECVETVLREIVGE